MSALLLVLSIRYIVNISSCCSASVQEMCQDRAGRRLVVSHMATGSSLCPHASVPWLPWNTLRTATVSTLSRSLFQPLRKLCDIIDTAALAVSRKRISALKWFDLDWNWPAWTPDCSCKNQKELFLNSFTQTIFCSSIFWYISSYVYFDIFHHIYILMHFTISLRVRGSFSYIG